MSTVEVLPAGYRLVSTNGRRLDLRSPKLDLLGFAFERSIADGSWAIGIWDRNSVVVGSKAAAKQVLRDYAADRAVTA